MTEPDPIITSHMVNPELSILPPKYYSENTAGGRWCSRRWEPAGTNSSPIRRGQGLVLKAFDKYRLGKPPVDDVIVKAVPETATRISELEGRFRRSHGRTFPRT